MKGESQADMKKAPLLATDGVEMGEFEISNVKFIAYDFAGAISLLNFWGCGGRVIFGNIYYFPLTPSPNQGRRSIDTLIRSS